jgi:hypothetical protein
MGENRPTLVQNSFFCQKNDLAKWPDFEENSHKTITFGH